MKVFIIAAQTIDGFIARNSDERADWTSSEDKKLFVRLTKQAGVMVMGSTTYKTIGRALPGRRTVVYSRQQPPADTVQDVEYTSEDPAALISRLEAEGFTEVAICGGQAIYSLFMRAGIIDELYITVEPFAFGNGISLFDGSVASNLTLLESTPLSDNVILLHYAVQRPAN